MQQAQTIYLDYNATAPLRNDARHAMLTVLEKPANASSMHGYGRAAKKHLEDARKIIAELINVWPNEIIFTSCGTEANAMALSGITNRKTICSTIEHSGVSHYAAPILPVDSNGVIMLEALEQRLKKAEGELLISVMLANNETGVIQPIAQIAKLCKEYDALLHCDAVQGLGKIPLDFSQLGVDMMSISAHKCGGPVGAAALVVRQDLPLNPMFKGGGQELGRRAGTENVAAIAGFAAAAQYSVKDMPKLKQQREWLNELEEVCIAQGGKVAGKDVARLPNTSCMLMPGMTSEVQLMNADLAGFAISAGSACSSGRITSSHVLKAMGFSDKLAANAIRISSGWDTERQEVEAFTTHYAQTVKRLQKMES